MKSLYVVVAHCPFYLYVVCGVIMCCIIFTLALKATFRSFDLFRSFFACCLFCFVFIFPLRTTPRPSRSKKVVRSSGPLVPRVRRRRTAPVASAAPATRPTPPETATSPSVVAPNATMIQGIAKAVSEAVIQSLTPFMMSNQSDSASALKEAPVNNSPNNAIGADATFQGSMASVIKWAFNWGGSSSTKW